MKNKCSACVHVFKNKTEQKFPKKGDILHIRSHLIKDSPLEVISIKEAPSRICMILRHNSIADNHYSVDSCSKAYLWKKYEYYKPV